MRDEISFRSLVVKSNNENLEENQNIKSINEKNSENDLTFFMNKQKSSTSNLSSNINNNNSLLNIQNKNDSKINKVKAKIKEYFEKNKQLNKKDFNSFISFIGLSDIWSSEEQMFLWESIITKAKKEDNIDYEETLSCICEFFEYEDEDEDEEIIDKKSACFEKINNSYLDISQNENFIDEYLNSIKDNIKVLFAIKFINEIFLKNNTSNTIHHYSINTINTMNVNNSIANDDLDKSYGEGDIEVIQIDNNRDDKKIIININEIMNEINNKYRFILIDKEEINNYFNYLKKNVRRSESINNIVLKNEKKQEICLDKELINYVSATIKLKLETEINKDSGNIEEENEDNKEIIKEESEKTNKEENDINEKNRSEINYDNILEEFNKLDVMISDSYEAIANFNKNKDLINLISSFNENYIMNNKKVLYDKINQLILENKQFLERKNKKEDSEKKFNINENNQNLSRAKILIVPDDENDYLRQQNQNLKERNEYLQKENAELRENISKNINDISSNNNKTIINKLNLTNNNQNNQNINLYSNRKQNHFRNKTAGDENILLNNIINQNNLKNNLNNNMINTLNSNSNINNSLNNTNNQNNTINTNIGNNSILITESDQNISNSINNNNTINNTNKNILQFNKTNTNSFYDCNLEEIANSHSEMFSIIGNNTSINDKFLFETTVLGNNQNEKNQGTPTLTPRSNIFDVKDENNSSYINILTSNSRSSDLNSDSANYGKNMNNENKKNSHYKNRKNEKMGLNVNNFNKNKFTLAGDNNMNKEINLDLMNKIDKKNFYDFKYLFQNRKAMKLLLYNNEKVKASELYSDQIYYILNGNKKKKGILLITSQCFYILDDSEDMSCEIRISHNLLSSISIPRENFNHLLISFSDNSYIIIETYRRIHLLNYLKELYLCIRKKKIDAYFCESFNIKLRNNHSFLYDFKNNKDIILTPNFENAQKIGFLEKYKENFFSAYFSEKLVVLCSIGLVVFSKSNIIIPKLIIPIIGSTIKPMTANSNEKLFCFKIKTINNENFIFGSHKNKEINDWIQELKNYQRLYDQKMNEIMTNFNVRTKKTD